MDTERPGEPFRLLFVCTGNTCRSPIAEVIARRIAAERGWARLKVRSAGIATVNGGPASEGSERVVARHGLDLSGHRSTQLTPGLVAWADLVLAMSPPHLSRAREQGGGDKADLLIAFAAGGETDDEAGKTVPDPVGGSDADYEATFAMLEGLVERALHRIAPLVAP